MLNPAMNINQKASYDAFAPHYREYSDAKKAYINAVDQVILEHTNDISSIFDFGAGDGVRGARLKSSLQANLLVQGDISQEMLKHCQNQGHADTVIDTSIKDWHKNTEQFDLVVALWNVLGHISSYEARLETLKTLKKQLSPKGCFIFDVNNRHNDHYGKWRSLYRRVLDRLIPDYQRGDAHFQWHIDGQDYPAYGHLFTLAEVQALITDAGFTTHQWLAVNYTTGETSKRSYKGQLVFICR